MKAVLRVLGFLLFIFVSGSTNLAAFGQEPTATPNPEKSADKASPSSFSGPSTIDHSPNEEGSSTAKSTSETQGLPPSNTSLSDGKNGAPLIVGDEEVLRIKVRLGPYGPDKRIESIQSRLKTLEEQKNFSVESISTRESGFSTDIVVGDVTLLTVTDADARAVGSLDRQALAKDYASRLQKAIAKDLANHSLPKLFLRIGLSLFTTVLLVGVWSLIGKLFRFSYKKIESWRGVHIRSLKFQQAVLLSADTFTDVVIGLCSLTRLVMALSLLAVYCTVVLSFFPETQDLSKNLISSALLPLTTVILPAVLGYLPNIAFIAIIILGTYYVLAFTEFIFSEISRGTISFPGFDPEWANPTYKIARFLFVAFALVLIFPYLPGSGSPAFQQVSLFLGILVSLGSSGAVSHVVAGVFLTYTGAFKIGDRVKISDTIGDVVEKTLLATRIRTIKHEYITIPNGMVLGSHIINYSSSAQDTGLILHTTITIGYDAPWKQIHQLLINAALETPQILADPQPFVLQTSLDDYYVSYQINAYTNNPHRMAALYSELHQNIQNTFNEAGVEIMSPHYSTLRDGNQSTIPQDYLTKDYKSPSFAVSVEK